MKKLLTFILSLGFFILLPNALADGEGGLSIKAPMSKQVQSENSHVILMTLKVTNIQVRAEWRVSSSVVDVFGIDAQSGVLSVLADKQQTLIATVFVEDQFNLLNSQYANLTASAVLTVEILGISLSDAPRLYADVGNAVSLHTFTARGGAGTKTYTIVAGDEDYFTLDSASGVLSLRANATVGIYTLSVKVIDGATEEATALAIVEVVLPLSLARTTLYGYPGVAIHQFTASGGIGTKTYTIVASDEDYFTLDSASGVLSLRASATVGVYTLSVKVIDEADEEATALAIVEVALPLFLARATLYGYAGVTIHQFTASGGTGAKTYWLDPNYNPDFFVIDAESGILSVSANVKPEVYSIYPEVIDTKNNYTYVEVIVVIVPHLSLPRPPLLFGSAGVAMSLHTFTASGGFGAKTYTVTADPEDYFTLGTDSGILSLRATAMAGIYTLSIQATDELNNMAEALATVEVLSLYLANPPTLYAVVGEEVNLHTFTASGGMGAKTYTIIAGNTDGYFTLGSASGILSLSAAATLGFYTLSVEVMDEVNQATVSVIVEVVSSLSVADAPPLSTYPAIALSLHTFTVSGGGGAKTFAIISGNEAGYFIVDAASGIFSVESDALLLGDYTLLVEVSDRALPPHQATAAVTVNISRLQIESLTAGDDGITVTWLTISHADSYYLYRQPGISSDDEMLIATLTASPYTDTSATANTLYLYRLDAIAGAVTLSSSIEATYGTVDVDDIALLDFTKTYYSSPEIEAQMRVLAEKYPQYATFTVIGESIEGRNIAALKITDHNIAAEEKVQAVMLGGYHAREWIAYNFVHMLGEYLITAAASDESKTLSAEGLTYDLSPLTLLAGAEVWVVPAVNPDGREYTKIDRLWRKNRRDNGDGTFGVDLNRNHSYKWGELKNGGSSGNTNDITYRGVAANSEPETQAVCRLMYNLSSPNMVISYHNYGQLILHPWGWGSEASTPGYENLETLNPPEYEYMHGIAVTMSIMIKGVHDKVYDAAESGAGLYGANGASDDWVYAVFQIPSYTFELPPAGNLGLAGFALPESEIWPTFQENLPAALYSIERAIANKDREYAGERVAPRDIAECSPNYRK